MLQIFHGKPPNKKCNVTEANQKFASKNRIEVNAVGEKREKKKTLMYNVSSKFTYFVFNVDINREMVLVFELLLHHLWKSMAENILFECVPILHHSLHLNVYTLDTVLWWWCACLTPSFIITRDVLFHFLSRSYVSTEHLLTYGMWNTFKWRNCRQNECVPCRGSYLLYDACCLVSPSKANIVIVQHITTSYQ